MNAKIRIEQTRREMDQLTLDIRGWLNKRNKADAKLRQYQTQLNLLGALLEKSLKDLESSLGNIVSNQVRSTYSACRLYDQRLAWVRSIWEYFRNKFDQRDDGRLGSVLAVADEVVWSCYTEVYQNLPLGAAKLTLGSAPLPYIEPRYSPQAVPRYEPPPGLKSEADPKFIQDYLNQLPIPVVSLPTTCVSAPWWLVLLGHEVGHHVQYDLLPDTRLISDFSTLLESAVSSEEEPEGDLKDQKRWSNWGREIFADLFSILTMGPWAIWAMTEMETSDDASMLKSKALYPSPIVRLSLMTRVASELGLGETQLTGLDVNELLRDEPLPDDKGQDLREIARRDLKFVPKLARSMVESPLGDLGQLKKLCGWNASDFLAGGTVGAWTDDFRQGRPLYPEASLRAARMAISGLMAAWSQVTGIEDDKQREKELSLLKRDEVLATIAKSREAKTRAAAPQPMTSAEDLGAKLAQLLIDAGPEELRL